MSRAKTSAKSTGFKMDFESGSRLVRFRFQKPATCCNGSSRKFANACSCCEGAHGSEDAPKVRLPLAATRCSKGG